MSKAPICRLCGTAHRIGIEPHLFHPSIEADVTLKELRAMVAGVAKATVSNAKPVTHAKRGTNAERQAKWRKAHPEVHASNQRRARRAA